MAMDTDGSRPSGRSPTITSTRGRGRGERGRAGPSLGGSNRRGGGHDPQDGAAWVLCQESQDGGSGTDLDVVGVRPDDQQVERSGSAKTQAMHLRHARSGACQTAHGGRPVS